MRDDGQACRAGRAAHVKKITDRMNPGDGLTISPLRNLPVIRIWSIWIVL